MAELEAKVLIDQAMEATGLSDFGGDSVAGGARPAARLAQRRGRAQRDRRWWSRGRDRRLPVQPARRGRGAQAAPGDRRRAGRPADRHRRAGPHGHDHPLRPPRAGPGHPRAAHLGGRPPVPAAGDRHLPHRPPHRRGGGERWRASTSCCPEFRAMHPMGARLAQECVRITGARLPQLHLPDAVPGAELRPLAARRGRHGRRPTAWHRHVPPAPAVAPPGDPVGGEVARAHLAPRRAAGRVPGRAARADPPRSAADHRLDRLAGADPAVAGQRRRRRARRRRPSSPTTSSRGSTGRSRPGSTAPSRPTRWSTRSSPSFMADPLATIGTIYDRLGPRAHRRGRVGGCGPSWPHHSQDEHGGHRYTFAATGLDEAELRARTRAYQEHFEVPSEPLP